MFSFGSMMGMMGGAPVVKSGDVIINKLKAAKVMEAGDTSDVMSKNMTSGLQGILKNPLQQKGGGAKQSSQNSSNRLGASGEIGPTTKSAIDGNLIPAIDNLMSDAADLVGIGPNPTGLLDSVSASNMLSTIGRADSKYSEEALLGPASPEAEALLDEVSVGVENVSISVVNLGVTDQDGAVVVNRYADRIWAIVQAGRAARLAAEEKAVYLASLSTAGALLQGGSDRWKSIMERAIKPDVLETIRQRNEDFVRPNPEDQVIET